MSNNFKINQKGLIFANLGSVSGYTIQQALIELFHNSQDAEANKILIYFESDDKNNYYINIIDNGLGMDYDEIAKMNELYKHSEKGDDNNHGTFGYGAKGAMLCIGGEWTFLSKKVNTEVINRLYWNVELMKFEVTDPNRRQIADLDPKCIRICDESGPKNTDLFNKLMSKINSKYGTIARCKLPYGEEYDIDDFEEQLEQTIEEIKFKNNKEECEVLFLNSRINKNNEIAKIESFDVLDYQNTNNSRKTKITIYGRFIGSSNPYPEFYIKFNTQWFKYKHERRVESYFIRCNNNPNNLHTFDKLDLYLVILSESQVNNQRKLLKKKEAVDYQLSGIFIDRNGNLVYTDCSCWNTLRYKGNDVRGFSANYAPSNYGDIIRGGRCLLSYEKSRNKTLYDKLLGIKANKSDFSIKDVNPKFKEMIQLIVDSTFVTIRDNWKNFCPSINIKEDRYLEKHPTLCNIPTIILNILRSHEMRNERERIKKMKKEQKRLAKIKKKAEEDKKAREQAERDAEQAKQKAREDTERKAEEHRKAREQARKAKEQAEKKAEEHRKAREQAEKKAEEHRKAREQAEKKAEEARKNLQQKINKQMADEKARKEKIAAQVVNQTDENFKEKINNNLGIVWRDVTKNPDFTDEKRKKMAEINLLLEEYINNFLND